MRKGDFQRGRQVEREAKKLAFLLLMRSLKSVLSSSKDTEGVSCVLKLLRPASLGPQGLFQRSLHISCFL